MTEKAKGKANGKAVAIVEKSADELTESERENYERSMGVVLSRPPRAQVKLEDKKLTIGGDEPKTLDGALIQEAFGTRSNQVSDHLMQRVIADAIQSTGNDAADAGAIANAFALVAAIEPQNELEANMAVQMVAANEATLFCFRRMKSAQYMEHAATYSNMANKAARTFAMQMEALQKLRRGGEQVVRHVHVNEGGQAVIAGTFHGGSK